MTQKNINSQNKLDKIMKKSKNLLIIYYCKLIQIKIFKNKILIKVMM